jgi:hypothetical protein
MKLRRALRGVGYLWSAPTVAICLLVWFLPLWLAGQLRPARFRDGAWEWSVVPDSLLFKRYSVKGWAATTLGWAIFFSPGTAEDRRTAIHERAHVVQSLWLGPLYLPVYGLIFLFTGYTRHPMEVHARAVEDRESRKPIALERIQ